MSPNLSVIIITKNEELDLPRAIRSVPFADEVIVLDSGSTDRSVEVAQALGAKVSVTSDWPGYGPQKNRALDLATGDWILSLDADEWLEPKDQALIRGLLKAGGGQGVAAYELLRKSVFIDRLMLWGDWRSDRVVRLFRRGAARFSDDVVHERLIVDGLVRRSQATLLHHPFKSLNELREKMYRYNGLAAKRLASQGKGGRLQAWTHGGFSFIRGFVLRAGFLDGWRGLQLAFFNAKGTWLRYAGAASELEYRRMLAGRQSLLDRWFDFTNLMLVDHGLLRLVYKNRFRLAGGLFRSNQPSPEDLLRAAGTLGIRSVVNLRGENTQHGWYRLEVATCNRLALRHVNTLVFSRGLLEPAQLADLKRVIEELELPALVHCKSGADRAGFFSAIYRHFRLGEPIEDIVGELAAKYGHFSAGKTGVLDHFFRTYLNERRPRQPFFDWVLNDYKRLAVEATFAPSKIGSLLTEKILQRE